MSSPASSTSSDLIAQASAQRSRSTSLFSRLAQISEGRSWAYLLLLPSLILVTAVVIYPVGYGVFLSLNQFNLMRASRGMQFVGLQQYTELFADANFRIILRNTLVWVLVGSVTQFTLGMITALALNRRRLKFAPLARVLILLPWVIPSVVAGHMWALLLDSRLGVINDILVRLGVLESYHAWFADPSTAMATVLLVDLWRAFPFFTLLFYAGLQAIPDELYEAAEVDGANPLQKFRSITLPMLTPVIVAAVILRMIGLVNSPDLMIVLTNGGPGLSTYVLSLYAFATAYESFNFGAAAAVSVIMLVILMVFSTLYLRFSGVTRD
jgi:multiple sugar transport system permease protein